MSTPATCKGGEQAHVSGKSNARALVWGTPDTWWLVVASTLYGERTRNNIRAVSRTHALDTLAWSIASSFTHVELYHGCRPLDVTAYYREGLRRNDSAIVDRARAVFCAQGIPHEAIEVAIAGTDVVSDRGRLYLALDGEHLVHQAGHYLLYGSETIMAIGATLVAMGYRDSQNALSKIGRPALIRCHLPTTMLPFDTRRELASTLYDAYRRARGRMPRRMASVDHTIVLQEDVPADALLSHSEPRSIVDWHRTGTGR